MVTGALVVMKDYFRDELLNTDLVVAALRHGLRPRHLRRSFAIYGHGLLDLAAALSPQGTPRVSLGARVEDADATLDLTRLSLGSALGDGLTQALAGQEIAAFDDLGAPFWHALDSRIDAAPGPWAGARLRDFMAEPEPGREARYLASLPLAPSRMPMVPPAPLLCGWTCWRGLWWAPMPGTSRSPAARSRCGLRGRRGLSAAAFSTEGLDGQAPVSGATLAWRPDGAPLGVRGGLVGEREAMLGSAAAGAFGRLAAGSAFVGVEGSATVGPWRLGAGAEVGTVGTSAQGGLIAGVSPLTTSAFALQAERPLPEDGTFTLSLSQPLRVEAGSARLSVPVGRTKDGFVRRHAVTAGLAPTGREIEFAAQWRKVLSTGGELRLGAAWTRHPGHAAAADPDLTLLAGWRHSF